MRTLIPTLSLRLSIRLFCLAPALLAGSLSLPAQVTGGDAAYEFMDLPASARLQALRNNLISISDGDVALASLNPASLNEQAHGRLSFSHAFLLAGTQTGYFAYGHHLAKAHITTHFALRYMNYGDFAGTDELGMTTTTFKAKEVAMTLGASKELYPRLSVGLNLKVVSSAFEQYNSWGLLGDLGFLYRDTSRDLSIGLVFRQFGRQLTTYAGTREPVPYDLQVALSKRLKYLPFRLTLMYHSLNRWNILYDDPNAEEPLPLFSDEQPSGQGFNWLDNLARHFTLSGEFLLGKRENFNLRLGYDHQLQREMKVRSYRSLAGFSLGFGLKINRFKIDYGHSFQHLAGGYNYFSVSTLLSEFRKGGG